MTDRELDVLVAERVMGRHIQFIRSEPFEYKDDLSAPLGMTCNFGGAIYTSDRDWLLDDWLDVEANLAVAHYSSDIAAAWRVVEKMVADGHVFIVKGDGLRTGDHNPKWTVLCDNYPRVDSDTAPRAICLAALRAKGVEVG